MEEITIRIPRKGLVSGESKLTAHVKGIKGASCVEEAQKIIHQPVASSEPTDEYYQRRDEVVTGFTS